MASGWSSSGSFAKTIADLKKMAQPNSFSALEKYGQEGVDALQRATPVDTTLTSESWYYEIVQEGDSWSIIWGNSNMAGPTPVAVLLQYGHGTRTGGYVQGVDYINPALRPVLDKMAAEGWKVVTGK